VYIIEILVPVVFIVALGYVANFFLKIDVSAPSRLTLYILLPALVFNSLYTSATTSAEFITLFCFLAMFTALMVGFITAVGAVFALDRKDRSALVLASTFGNTGYLGSPIVLFALGQQGFERALLYMVCQQFFMFSVGVFYAASSKNSVRRSLLGVLRMPSLYAAVLAYLLRSAGLSIPSVLHKGISMMAGAALPVMLLIMGMQFHALSAGFSKKTMALGTAIKLVIAPLLAYGLVSLLPVERGLSSVLVLQTAMPTAMNIAVVSMEYDASPDVVCGTAMLSTVLCPLTLSVLLWLLL